MFARWDQVAEPDETLFVDPALCTPTPTAADCFARPDRAAAALTVLAPASDTLRPLELLTAPRLSDAALIDALIACDRQLAAVAGLQQQVQRPQRVRCRGQHAQRGGGLIRALKTVGGGGGRGAQRGVDEQCLLVRLRDLIPSCEHRLYYATIGRCLSRRAVVFGRADSRTRSTGEGDQPREGDRATQTDAESSSSSLPQLTKRNHERAGEPATQAEQLSRRHRS
ncbi:MAG: hypothetical protein ACRDWT_06160 [Jatrophihabitantaceae bacterium]